MRLRISRSPIETAAKVSWPVAAGQSCRVVVGSPCPRWLASAVSRDLIARGCRQPVVVWFAVNQTRYHTVHTRSRKCARETIILAIFSKVASTVRLITNSPSRLARLVYTRPLLLTGPSQPPVRPPIADRYRLPPVDPPLFPIAYVIGPGFDRAAAKPLAGPPRHSA
jgi:hypothetical protein